MLSSAQAILNAETTDEFLTVTVRFTRELGFQTVTAMAVVDSLQGVSEFLCIDNAPRDYEGYEGGDSDPVLQHCKRSSLPIVWDQKTYIDADRIDKWDEQARFGYRYGICYAMHLPNGRHFCFGVDRDQPLPGDAEEIARMIGALQLFAAYAQVASERILLPFAATAKRKPLVTARELEALRWTLEGKTAWEVGRILGIAENTAVRHVHSATRKLGCANKHHAAVKALRFGLIS